MLDLYLGRLDLINCAANRPSSAKIRTPFGLEPNASAETSVQVPTSCLAVSARAVPGSKTSPNTVIAERLRMLRRFIVFPPFWMCAEHRTPPLAADFFRLWEQSPPTGT